MNYSENEVCREIYKREMWTEKSHLEAFVTIAHLLQTTICKICMKIVFSLFCSKIWQKCAPVCNLE